MSKVISGIKNGLKNILEVSLSTSVIITLISWIGGFNLPRTFFTVGIIWTIIGVFSVLGNYKISTDIGYQQARSVSSVPYYNNFIEDSSTKGNHKLLITAVGTGIILLIISGFLETSNISIFAISLLKNIF